MYLSYSFLCDSSENMCFGGFIKNLGQKIRIQLMKSFIDQNFKRFKFININLGLNYLDFKLLDKMRFKLRSIENQTKHEDICNSVSWASFA